MGLPVYFNGHETNKHNSSQTLPGNLTPLTLTQARQPPATHPTTAAPKISQAEFSLHRNTTMRLVARMGTLTQSFIEPSLNSKATTAISASDPTTTPSNTAPAAGERR